MTLSPFFYINLYKLFVAVFFSLEGKVLTPKTLIFSNLDTTHLHKPYKSPNNTPFGEELVEYDERVQSKLVNDEKIRSTVRMTDAEHSAVMERFGGIQLAWDSLTKQALGETSWLPDMPKRIIPSFKAIRDAAKVSDTQVLSSAKLRDLIMCAADCSRKTAVRHLHELKSRRLIYTFGRLGDECFHFIVCNPEDHEKIKKVEVM